MSNVVPLNAHTISGFTDKFLAADYNEFKRTPACHMEWWELATSPHQHVAFAAPREHAKSTGINHAYGLAASLFQQHPFQIKISKTYKLACEKIEQAKITVQTNERIKHIFKLKKIVRDREDDFIAEMSDGYQFRMMALGMGQAARGLSWGTIRPTLINGDDMEDDEEVLNKERREKAWRWLFNTLLPMGGDNTLIRIYGTILHEESLLNRLIKMPSWHGRIWEACDDQVSEASILWPEKFPRERLLKIRQNYIDAGNLAGFNMEYRNRPSDDSAALFRKEDFIGIGEGLNRERLTYYVGMDFAITEETRSDYTTIVVAGMDTDGILYVVDVVRGRWSDGNEIIDQMFLIEEAYHPAEWFAEDGMIRKGLGAALELRMREYNGGMGLYLNITPMTPVKSKRVRAANIRARVRGKSVRFDRDASWFPDFEEELKNFDRGKNDDQVDAFAWLGIGLARMVTPLSEDEEEEIDRDAMRKEHLTFGRSAVTGY